MLTHGVGANDDSSAMAAASPTPASANSDDQTSADFFPIIVK